MPRLIIVAGASGAGKSFLLQSVRSVDKSVRCVRKLTTRSPRRFETPDIQQSLDLIFDCKKERIDACDFSYPYDDHSYGTRKSDIDECLAQGINPILIVRSYPTIARLKDVYPDALVLYLQGGLSGDDLRRKLKEQGREDIDIETRMERIRDDFSGYVQNIHLFDYVLVNHYERTTLLGQLDSVLFHALKEDTRPDYVFLLMPFKEEFDVIHKAIQTAGRLLNGGTLNIERIDMRHGDFHIVGEILRSIREAALIVCDVSEPNPNVMFELGYARGINKKVLHCAHSGTKLPFDISHNRHLCYDDAMDLQEQMIEEFRYFFPELASRPRK